MKQQPRGQKGVRLMAFGMIFCPQCGAQTEIKGRHPPTWGLVADRQAAEGFRGAGDGLRCRAKERNCEETVTVSQRSAAACLVMSLSNHFLMLQAERSRVSQVLWQPEQAAITRGLETRTHFSFSLLGYRVSFLYHQPLCFSSRVQESHFCSGSVSFTSLFLASIWVDSIHTISVPRWLNNS